LFAAFGAFFVAYGMFLAAERSWGVAVFLVGMGAASLFAAWLCSERTLTAIGTAAVLINVAAAVVALVAGVRL